MFLTKPFPDDLAQTLREHIDEQFQDRPVAVRSSAPEEDNAQSSFAGLHESFINVAGAESVLKHIRLVWASLWSDAALLYRQEIGLDVEKSAMAVVVQETVAGDRSGVAFTRNPNDESQGIVESVHGLNQGLVDGTVEPDRWTIDRYTNKIVLHTAPERKNWIMPGPKGVHLEALPAEKSTQPPLVPQEVDAVFQTALKAEKYFDTPQDVEWTYDQDELVLLQSRPITTLSSDKPQDERGWYLSLHRSFDNLKELRRKIEEELIPGMIAAAENLGARNLKKMSDQALADEIRKRLEINSKWVNVYWADFIPYAHGVRLFGQVYNDALHPEDPYEFMDLLTNTQMASIERNNMLMDLAAMIRRDEQLAEVLKDGNHASLDVKFTALIDEFIEKFGDLSCAVTGGKNCVLGTGPLYRLLLEMAKHPAQNGGHRKKNAIKRSIQKYVDHFEEDQKAWAMELLELARNSYQLRDDDNIYLGRIEAQLLTAVQEAKKRLENRADDAASDVLRQVIEEVDFGTDISVNFPHRKDRSWQVSSSPTDGSARRPGHCKRPGPGDQKQQERDLRSFGVQAGDVLVCDAVDPNITFVIPMTITTCRAARRHADPRGHHRP